MRVVGMSLVFSSLCFNEGHPIGNCTGVACPAGSYVACSLDCRYNCDGSSVYSPAVERCQQECKNGCQCQVPPCDASACDPSKDFPCGCSNVCVARNATYNSPCSRGDEYCCQPGRAPAPAPLPPPQIPPAARPSVGDVAALFYDGPCYKSSSNVTSHVAVQQDICIDVHATSFPAGLLGNTSEFASFKIHCSDCSLLKWSRFSGKGCTGTRSDDQGAWDQCEEALVQNGSYAFACGSSKAILI